MQPPRLAEKPGAIQPIARFFQVFHAAIHKLAGMVSAFSTVAGGVASELEDRAAQGQLEEAQPLAARLEAMTEELMQLAGCRSTPCAAKRRLPPNPS
jgi:hypothetical protein